MENFYTLATLRAELKNTLGLDSIEALTDWLESPGVKPFMDEFVSDYLTNNPTANDADYTKVTNLLGANAVMNFAAYDTTSSGSSRPDKTGWSAEKHWVRFIWQMGQYAKTHTTAWQAPREEEMEVWFWHGYEVVKFLKAEYANERELENAAA
ncbi:hypothetical protein PG997_002747 [Apiospora hydei]|uniref:Uncharacterized protein n=1 Tax=Apiospora hydei TaxID=1337664 RepID=A0ABR1WX96_9PEZI